MRDAFRKSLDHAMVHFRGSKQNAIYSVFAEFDWNVEDDEIEYACTKAGFKSGWAYYHRKSQLTEIRRQHEAAQQEREAERRMRDEIQRRRAANQRQQSANQAEARARAQQYQQAAENLRRQQEAHMRSQFEWLFRAGMNQHQQASNGCPGYIEPMVRRFGLTWPYTAAELKKAYRKKCMDTHPDRGGAAEAFQQVQKDNTELERYAQGAA